MHVLPSLSCGTRRISQPSEKRNQLFCDFFKQDCLLATGAFQIGPGPVDPHEGASMN